MQTKLNHTILKLKQDVPTKWNSTYEMIDRFLKNKEPLLSCIAVLGITFDWIAEDWTLMEHAVKLLEFFDTATKNVTVQIDLERHFSRDISRQYSMKCDEKSIYKKQHRNVISMETHRNIPSK